MKAIQTEMFRWSGSSNLRGFVLEADDGTRFPGDFVVDLDDLDASIEKELARYFSSYVVFTKAGDTPPTLFDTMITNKDGSITTYGSWGAIDPDETRAAVKLAIV